MNIVYNCNDAYAVHTAVSIVSLFENNSSVDCIAVYILGNGLSDESKRRFSELAGRYTKEGRPRSIEIIELNDYAGLLGMLFGGKVDAGSFDITVLARLFAPSHLPDSVERYLYLDADTVVLGSISRLYELTLDGRVCAMAAEPTIYEATREALGIGRGMPYFNSGVILVDRLRWEEEQVTGKCIDYFTSIGRRGLDFPDQDILNYVLKGRVKVIEPKYNFFSNYHYRSYRSLTAQAEWYAGLKLDDGVPDNEAVYNDARNHPCIVHFAGAERPWYRGSRNPYRHEYMHYLELTPWKGTGQQTGHELYMLMYHCMNLVTAVCPGIRQLISVMYLSFRYNRKLQ